MAEGAPVGVGVAIPFWTVTVTAAAPSNAPPEAYPLAEIVCCPLAMLVEFQLKLTGGVEPK